jgi:hypothetical protein
MKLRNTIILFVLFASLALYVYLVEVKKHAKDEEFKKSSKKIFTLAKDSIEVLKFRNQNGFFHLQKVQEEWKIIEPLATEADNSTVTSMLLSLINADKDKEFNIKADEISSYGLDSRALFVQVKSNSGEEDSLKMGDKTPVGSFVFSNKNDSVVFTLNQSVKTAFDKKFFDIRDKKLLHFQRDDVRKVVIKTPREDFEFEKSSLSDWTFANINRPADNGKISGLLSKLQNNQIQAFVDEEGKQLKKYGLSTPKYQVELLLGPEKGQKRFFMSGKIDGKYYARDEARKPIFEIDTTIVKDVDRKRDDFRDKDIVDFDRNQVTRVRVVMGDTSFTCIKDTAGNWFMDDSLRQEVERTNITSLFSWLDYTNISEFVKDGKYNPADYGFDSPRIKLSLYNSEDLLAEAIIGNVKNGSVYAVTNQFESVYLIPKTKLIDFKTNLDKFFKESEKEEEIS